MTFTAYTPSPVSTSRTCSATSRVVRCQGTASPPNASPTTRSNRPRGCSRSPVRASPTRTVSPGIASTPSCSPAERDHAAVDLQHRAAGARPGRGQVARHGEPAAADVQRLHRRARPAGSRRPPRRSPWCSRTPGTSGRPGRRTSAAACRAPASGRRARSGSATTRAQWYSVSCWHGFGATTTSSSATGSSAAAAPGSRPVAAAPAAGALPLVAEHERADGRRRRPRWR